MNRSRSGVVPRSRHLLRLRKYRQPATTAPASPSNTTDDGSGVECTCGIRTSPIWTMPVPSGTLVKNWGLRLESFQSEFAEPSRAKMPNDPDAFGEAKKSICSKLAPRSPRN